MDIRDRLISLKLFACIAIRGMLGAESFFSAVTQNRSSDNHPTQDKLLPGANGNHFGSISGR